jgi:hypothetical protein
MTAPETRLTSRQRGIVGQATGTLTRTAAEIAAGMPGIDVSSREEVYRAAYSRTKVALAMALAVVDELSAAAAVRADQLAALAGSIDERLGDGDAGRQTIAEDAAAQLRKLAGGGAR